MTDRASHEYSITSINLQHHFSQYSTIFLGHIIEPVVHNFEQFDPIMAQAPLPIFQISKIAPRIPPVITINELDRQAAEVTPALSANFDTTPTTTVYDRETAKTRARVISTHTGVGFPYHHDLVVGGVGASPILSKSDFNKISSEIFTERYGRSSFVLQWAAGESATQNFIVSFDSVNVL